MRTALTRRGSGLRHVTSRTGRWAAASLLLLASAAHAVVIEHPQDSMYTLDSQTGLAWLDLTETAGLSYLDVLELSADPDSALFGFRHASPGEIGVLIRNAGFDGNASPAARYESAERIQALLGTTGVLIGFENNYTLTAGITSELREVADFEGHLEDFRLAHAVIERHLCIQRLIIEAVTSDTAPGDTDSLCPLNYTPGDDGGDDQEPLYEHAVGTLALSDDGQALIATSGGFRLGPSVLAPDASRPSIGNWLVADEQVLTFQNPVPVPEPPVLALCGLAAALLAWRRRASRWTRGQ